LTYKARSPIHIGYGRRLGNVSRTRYYIPGKTMWGAVTATLSRAMMDDYSPQIYQDVGKFVRENLIFSYFYLKDDGDVLFPNYTWEGIKFGTVNGFSKVNFERKFITSYVSTALDKKSSTAEDESLHEVELISHKEKENGVPVDLEGYLFVNENEKERKKNMHIIEEGSNNNLTLVVEGKNMKLFENIKKLTVGGERNYGFGKLELKNTPKMTENMFGKEFDLENQKPIIEDKDMALSHVRVKHGGDNDINKFKEIRGDLEPVVGREWKNEDNEDEGPGRKVTKSMICLVPGTKFEIDEDVDIEINNYGMWTLKESEES